MNPGMEEIMNLGIRETLADFAYRADSHANVFQSGKPGSDTHKNPLHFQYPYAFPVTTIAGISPYGSTLVACLISHNASEANFTAI